MRNFQTACLQNLFVSKGQTVQLKNANYKFVENGEASKPAGSLCDSDLYSQTQDLCVMLSVTEV